MLVVGGSYREVCSEPAVDQLLGSGCRGAIAISRAIPDLVLCTCATTSETEELGRTADRFGFSLDVTSRDRPLEFQYDTPLSRPKHGHVSTPLPTLPGSANVALLYGMLDAIPDVDAEYVILDPQGLDTLEGRLNWHAQHLAIVGNRNEIAALAGLEDSVEACAQQVLAKYHAEVVVTKCGALGATVVDSEATTQIGVYPIPQSNPLGSGDVYSAVFAYYWGYKHTSTTVAAKAASQAAAQCAYSGIFQVLDAVGELVAPQATQELLLPMPNVYLAAPFFTVAERWLVNLCRDALVDLGAMVFSPWHDVGFGEADEVAVADIAGLDKSDSILALLDHSDSGAMFEIGRAHAQGIPVVCHASNPTSSAFTMVNGLGIPVFSDLATAVYQAIWKSVGTR